MNNFRKILLPFFILGFFNIDVSYGGKITNCINCDDKNKINSSESNSYIKNIKNSNDRPLAKISDSIVCLKATKKFVKSEIWNSGNDNNGKIWNMRNNNYVGEAKSRGLNCGTKHTSNFPQCYPKTWSSSWHKCVGTYVSRKGTKYVGEWKNGKQN